jgi:hypothetical protein
MATTALPLDPHPAWFAEWKPVSTWCNGPDGRDRYERPQWSRMLELEQLIARTPAHTLEGAGVQLRMLRYWADEGLALDKEAHATLANALATLGRGQADHRRATKHAGLPAAAAGGQIGIARHGRAGEFDVQDDDARGPDGGWPGACPRADDDADLSEQRRYC